MNPRFLPVATFLLGVVLTVGAYETVRLVNNARNALAVASNQMTEDDGDEVELAGEDGRADRRRRTAVRPGGAPVRPPPATRAPTPKRRASQGSGKRTPAERKAALEARLAEMTELERQEFLERRQARRDRRRNPGPPQPRAIAPVGAGAGPAYLRTYEGEAPVGEPELIDTAEP